MPPVEARIHISRISIVVRAPVIVPRVSSRGGHIVIAMKMVRGEVVHGAWAGVGNIFVEPVKIVNGGESRQNDDGSGEGQARIHKTR